MSISLTLAEPEFRAKCAQVWAAGSDELPRLRVWKHLPKGDRPGSGFYVELKDVRQTWQDAAKQGVHPDDRDGDVYVLGMSRRAKGVPRERREFKTWDGLEAFLISLDWHTSIEVTVL